MSQKKYLNIQSITTLLALLYILVASASCKSNDSAYANTERPTVGLTFNEDSAMVFCAKQCDFGPRTMNSEAHDKCGEWIIEKFQQYGCEVTTQEATLKGWDGTALKSTNIIAKVKPDNQKRILICAHWDSRPWADNDPDKANHHTPVMAANDGASGVAVMMELARILQGCDSLDVGLDLVCFDAEDYGTPSWSDTPDNEDTWALGAQYYAQNIQNMDTVPDHGILLDMVGGQGSVFYQEGLSVHYASNYVADIWKAAEDAGYGSYFVKHPGAYITDDHKPLNEVGLSTVDIIPYYAHCEASVFGPTWHTINDDMQHLDKNVLKAVGQTLVQYLFTLDK